MGGVSFVTGVWHHRSSISLSRINPPQNAGAYMHCFVIFSAGHGYVLRLGAQPAPGVAADCPRGGFHKAHDSLCDCAPDQALNPRDALDCLPTLAFCQQTL